MAMTVVRALERGSGPMSLKQVAEASGMAPSKVHRYLVAEFRSLRPRPRAAPARHGSAAAHGRGRGRLRALAGTARPDRSLREPLGAGRPRAGHRRLALRGPRAAAHSPGRCDPGRC
ncbi:helix-turn-helix domain-containing protein [Amycolatopsis sp. FDAARGOS 1241]|uniref:helix-turn-helix domain-containing protein n=1 Tax=Amycolatopsis sp. FDAARGOS 1241 TaxID=2778070 RepID=UPI00351C9DE0